MGCILFGFGVTHTTDFIVEVGILQMKAGVATLCVLLVPSSLLLLPVILVFLENYAASSRRDKALEQKKENGLTTEKPDYIENRQFSSNTNGQFCAVLDPTLGPTEPVQLDKNNSSKIDHLDPQYRS